MGRAEEDATDAALLEAGDFEKALARHLPALIARARAKVSSRPDADDVVQKAILRVFAEFREGRRWGGLPLRVVLHKRLDWTAKDHFAARRDEVGLPEGWDPPDDADPYADVEDRDYVEAVLADLPPREQQVARMRILEGMEPREIAERLGIEANAVHQALHRVRRRLGDVFDA